MHPVIAFLSFIFSPANDWLLKQAFELMVDPAQIPAAVESYDRIAEEYPSMVTDPAGHKHSADTVALAQWAEIMAARGDHENALRLLARLDKDPMIAPELVDDVQLRIGESSMNRGELAQAETYFQKIIEKPSSPRALDARINLLACNLAKGDTVAATQHAEELVKILGPDVQLSRGLLPLGLAAFTVERYEDAAKYLAMMDDDPRGHYFLGLSYRRMGKPQEALAEWQNLRKPNVEPFWTQLADFQVAETYFALGDDPLSRAACEHALAANPESPLVQKFEFRLAAIDFRSKNYEQALARLTPLLDNTDLASRSSILLAESMIKTGQSKDLMRVLARRKDAHPSAEMSYQTAWAAMYQKEHERAIATAMEGLQNFYDVDYTPRLMLLQGLSYEHLGDEANALATFQTVADYFPGTVSAATAAHWTMLAYMRAGRLREAVTHGSYLWSQLPEAAKRAQPETAFWIAEAHSRMNRWEDADKGYDDYLAFADNDNKLRPYGEFERAVALAKLDRPQDAIAMLNEFAATAKEQKETSWMSLAQLQRGHILFNDRQYAEAISAYRSADKSAKSLYHEGLALARLDYFTDAIDAWDKVVKDFPNDKLAEAALFRTGRTQFELGQATAAVQTFAMYIQTYPDNPNVKEARLQSAHALFNAGDVASAAPLYADYLSRYHAMEDLVAVSPYLGACYAQLGKTSEEVAGLMKGLPPTDAVASLQWNEGAQKFNDKKYDEATNIFALMLTQFPTHENSATALFYRGESFFLLQKWAEADAALASYLKMFPEEKKENAPLAMFHRGVSLYNQDKLLKAGAVFQGFLEQFPDDKLAADARENLYLCYHNLGDWDTAEKLKKKYETIITAKETDKDKQLAQNPEWDGQ